MASFSLGRSCSKALALVGLLVASSPFVAAQSTAGSRNVTLQAHLPLGGGPHGAVVLNPNPASPVAYIARHGAASGVDVVDVQNPKRPRLMANWRADGAQSLSDIALAHDGARQHLAVGTDRGLYLLQLASNGDLQEAARVSTDAVHALFAYHAGDGSRLLFVATRDVIEIRDLNSPETVVGTIALPEDARGSEMRFRGVYAQYDLETETDRLYAAGTGGYGVYDVTDPSAPTVVTTVSSAAVQVGVGIQATPDGSHVVTTANYPTAPIRIFDLRPALSGEIPLTRTAAGAWTDNWRRHAERFEGRWPYLFVAAGTEGLRMVNMRNPFEPYTTAYFHTWDGPVAPGGPLGAVDVDVRNRDGLIAVSDETTGLWLLTIDDFTHWDGRGWGLPNLSSTQDWDASPVLSDRWN